MNEEELLVLLEFSDKSEATYCGEYSNNFEILEIESSKPIVKIGQRLYSGEYQNNIGTYLFFSDSATTSSDSNEFNYKGKTYKKLILNRLYLKSNE